MREPTSGTRRVLPTEFAKHDITGDHPVAVPAIALQLRRAIYMVRPKPDSPHRVQEVFWDFAHSPSNPDLLSLPRAA